MHLHTLNSADVHSKGDKGHTAPIKKQVFQVHCSRNAWSLNFVKKEHLSRFLVHLYMRTLTRIWTLC